MCKDAALDHLAQLGYNAVRLPRENIKPLDVVGKARTFDRLGPLTDFCSGATTEAPNPTMGAAASLGAVNSSALEFGAGLSVLGGFLGLVGDTGALSAAYKGADRLRFYFDAPTSEAVDPSAVAKWLKTTQPDENSLVKDYLVDPDGRAAYVIVEVLTSSGFLVEALDKRGGGADASLPELEGVLSAKGSFNAQRETQGRVRYSGKRNLVFGFKAFRLVYDSFRFALQGVQPGTIFLGRVETKVARDSSGSERGVILDDAWVTVS